MIHFTVPNLAFPAKILWPNGRGHHMARHTAFKKHKYWAEMATREAMPARFRWLGGPIRLHYTITPKTAHAIDADNAIASLKAYQDGIAAALVIDDTHFAIPTIEFTAPRKPGSVTVTVEALP